MNYSIPLLSLISLSRDNCSGCLTIFDQDKSYQESEQIPAQIWLFEGEIAGCIGKGIDILDDLVSSGYISSGKAKTLKEFRDRENNEYLLNRLISIEAITQEQQKKIFKQQMSDASKFCMGVYRHEFTAYELTEFPKSNLCGLTVSVEEFFLKTLRHASPKLQKELFSDYIPNSILALSNVICTPEYEHLNERELKVIDLADSVTPITKIATLISSPNEPPVKVPHLKLICLRLKLLGYVDYAYPPSIQQQILAKLGRQVSDTSDLVINFDRNLSIAKGLGLFFVLVLLNLLGIGELFELRLYDLFVGSSRNNLSRYTTLVTVSDRDINFLKEYPISDLQMARAINNLQSAGAYSIGLDIYRDIDQGEGRQELLDAYNSTNIWGVEKVVHPRTFPPQTLAEKDKVAISDLIIDSDGFIRRYLISVLFEEEIRYGLGSALALDYLESKNIEAIAKDSSTRIGKANLRQLNSHDGFYRGIDSGGFQTFIPWHGDLTTFPQISFYDLIQNNFDPLLVRDRVVLIGVIADSVKDDFNVPFSRRRFGVVPSYGVVIHANVTEGLIAAAKGEKSLPTALPYFKDVGIQFISFTGGIVAGLLILKLKLDDTLPYSTPIVVATATIASGVAYLIIGYINFQLGVIYSVLTAPLLFAAGLFYSVAQLKELSKKMLYVDSDLNCGNQNYFRRQLERKLSKKSGIGIIAISFSQTQVKILNLLVSFLQKKTNSRYEVYRYQEYDFCLIAESSQVDLLKDLEQKLNLELKNLQFKDSDNLELKTSSFSGRQESTLSLITKIENAFRKHRLM